MSQMPLSAAEKGLQVPPNAYKLTILHEGNTTVVLRMDLSNDSVGHGNFPGVLEIYKQAIIKHQQAGKKVIIVNSFNFSMAALAKNYPSNKGPSGEFLKFLKANIPLEDALVVFHDTTGRFTRNVTEDLTKIYGYKFTAKSESEITALVLNLQKTDNGAGPIVASGTLAVDGTNPDKGADTAAGPEVGPLKADEG